MSRGEATQRSYRFLREIMVDEKNKEAADDGKEIYSRVSVKLSLMNRMRGWWQEFNDSCICII